GFRRHDQRQLAAQRHQHRGLFVGEHARLPALRDQYAYHDTRPDNRYAEETAVLFFLCLPDTVEGGMPGGVRDIDRVPRLCDQADQALASRYPDIAHGGLVETTTG